MYERIKSLCEKEGISIRELERRALLPDPTIIHWKKNENPTVRNLRKVADYFKVSLDYLVYGEERK